MVAVGYLFCRPIWAGGDYGFSKIHHRSDPVGLCLSVASGEKGEQEWEERGAVEYNNSVERDYGG